jgi:3-hydroxymyristoyl/3-hydroxydecanoyl-(acyl carrier protein) dehydratase
LKRLGRHDRDHPDIGVFHFVDQILELKPAEHALGLKHVTPEDAFLERSTPGAPTLLSCIVGEALGQLGAWTVMAANDFTLRPVAGVVGAVEILGEARVGDTVLLDTTIDEVRDDRVVYHARASVNATEILRLRDSLGPLLPLDQFDHADALRERFDRIRSEPHGQPRTAPAGSTIPADVPEPVLFDEIVDWNPGREAVAVKHIAEHWAFFEDHFPRRRMFPLSLLLESLLQLGQRLLDENPATGPGLRPVRVRNMKMSRFVEPGQSLTARVRVDRRTDDLARLRFRCEVEAERVCIGQAEYATVSGEGESVTPGRDRGTNHAG